MKKKYLIVFIFLCFLLSGCDTNYKINIDENLNVSEEITFNYDLSDYQQYEEDDNYVSSMLTDIKSQATESNYEVSDTSTSKLIDLKFTRKSSLDSFNSPIFNEIYSYFNTTCNSDKCSVTSVAKENDTEGDGTYINYKISITVPYKVLKQNADEVDLKNNTYIWYYIVGGKQSNINFVFEKQGKNIIEQNKRNSSIITVIYIIIGIAVLISVASVMLKINKNNKPSF